MSDRGFLFLKKKKRTATGCNFPLGDMKINVYTGSSLKVQHRVGGTVKILSQWSNDNIPGTGTYNLIWLI